MICDAKTAEAMEAELRSLLPRLDSRYMTIAKAMAIYEAMRRMAAEDSPPTRVLEIGTFAGTGAILLATMVEQWGGRVTTVDLPWTGRPNQHFAKTVEDRARELHVPNLTIVRREDGSEGWIRERLAATESVDLVYLDGGHGWRNTVLQVGLSLAYLRFRGRLVMDDLHNAKWPDVQEVWETLVCRTIPAARRYEKRNMGFVQVDPNLPLIPERS